MTKKFKALAYIGLAWLYDLVTFDLANDAIEALQESLDKQLKDETDEAELLSYTESFWFNSRIEEFENEKTFRH